ncbi:MAG: T9SS type A sorting domain-containing protein [Candidatus Marinimicrobia bacterium]|nr:T9SS type A sorting domain-containing protein [Candidatus Neomarinimicrobiota bacterium]
MTYTRLLFTVITSAFILTETFAADHTSTLDLTKGAGTETYLFYARNFQFFSGDYRLGATLQKSSINGDFFVENAVVLSSVIDETAAKIYLGTAHGGVFERDINGTTWQAISVGLPKDPDRGGVTAVNALAITSTGVLTAGTDRGIFTYNPSAVKWTPRGDERVIFDLLVDGNTIYAGMGGYLWLNDIDETGPDGDIDLDMGVWRSTDGGVVWMPFSQGLPTDDDNEHRMVYSLAKAGNNLYAATPAGLFRLENGQEYWFASTRQLDISLAQVAIKIQESGRDESELGADFFRLYNRWFSVDESLVNKDTDLYLSLYGEPWGSDDTLSQWLVELQDGILGDAGKYTLDVNSYNGYYNVSNFVFGYDTLSLANLRYLEEDSVATIINPREEVLLSLTDNQDKDYELAGQYATVTYQKGSTIYKWSEKVLALRAPNTDRRGVRLNDQNLIYSTSDEIPYYVLNNPAELQYFSAATYDVSELYTSVTATNDGSSIFGAADGAFTLLDGDNYIYAGTADGVSAYDKLTGEWENLAYLLPYTPMPVYTLLKADTSLYAGGQYGFYRYDGTTWIPENELLYGYITAAEIDNLAEMLDNSSPIDPAKGIYDILVNDIFGSDHLPDIDGSPKISILLHNIHDLSEEWNGTSNGAEGGAAEIVGYVRKADQSTIGLTNRRDMIYLNTAATSRTDRAAALAHQLVKLMMLSKDIDEERWIAEGIAFFGERECGFDLPTQWSTFPDLSGDAGMPLNSGAPGVAWAVDPADGNAIAELYIKAAVWMIYLYENIGGLDFIKALMNEPLNGIAGIDALLPDFLPAGASELSFSDLFSAWSIAMIINDTDQFDSVTGLRYGIQDSVFNQMIENYQVLVPGAGPGMGLKSLSPDAMDLYIDHLTRPVLYGSGLNNWATALRELQIDLANQDFKYWANKQYVINADDAANVRLWLLKRRNADGKYEVNKLSSGFNDQNELSFNVFDEFETTNADSTEYTYSQVVLALSNQSPGGGAAKLVQSIDNVPPEVDVSIVHNAIYPEKAKIYLWSTERLHSDVDAPTGPTVEAVRSIGTEAVTMALFDEPVEIDKDYFGSLYVGTLNFEVNDALSLAFDDLRDLSGNEVTLADIPITVGTLGKNASEHYLTAADNKLEISLASGSLDPAAPISIVVEPVDHCAKLTEVGISDRSSIISLYTIGPRGKNIDGEMDMTLRMSEEINPEDKMGVYRLGNKVMQPVSAEFNPVMNTLSWSSQELGTFAIALNAVLPAVETIMPLEYALAVNYPNPFNPVTNIAYALPEPAFASVAIFDLLGRRITTLVSSEHSAGDHIVRWYGNDQSGKPVGSGIYFYSIKTANFSATKKMILLK